MLLSIIMPVYNEAGTIGEILEVLEKVPIDKEIVIVDDCSSDGTVDFLKKLNKPDIRIFYHEKNMGKGSAIRTALEQVKGEITVIQDADLEYDPWQLPELLKLFKERKAEVVYGSRFMGTHTGQYFWNAIGNKFLTFLTNFLYNAWISDMETCYKMIKTDIFRSLELEGKGFEIEPEITSKLLKRGHRIIETPISYFGRTYDEGKKIHWKDGIRAIFTLLKYRFQD